MEWQRTSFHHLPRFDLLYEHFKHGLQPLKTTEMGEVEKILGEYNLKITEARKMQKQVMGTAGEQLQLEYLETGYRTFSIVSPTAIVEHKPFM